MPRVLWSAALLLVPLAAIARGSEYWTYSYQNVEVTAAGTSAYAVNLARYCVRLDGMLVRILGIRTSDRPSVHIYALPPAQVRQLLGNEDLVSFRTSPAGTIVVTSNSRDSGSGEYWGAYYGYIGALLASDGQLKGPDWYIHGVPTVFASTKYRGNRAQVGAVTLGYAITLGQGSALIPMRRFLSLKRATIEGNDATAEIYDAEAWGLAHEVFVEGWHRTEFARYLGLMREGTPEASAFATSFNMTYEQLDKEFANALHQRALAYSMDAPDPGGGSESAQPLSAEEVKARLASLATQYTKESAAAQ